MGLDIDGVGGIGMEFTNDMINCAIDSELFTETDWEEDPYECMEKLNIIYQRSGNGFSGDGSWYIFVDGVNLVEINNNIQDFLNKLEKIGIFRTIYDIVPIKDTYVW